MEALREQIERAWSVKAPRVVVAGDLMVDRYLWGRFERVSPEAPVPVVEVESERLALGGAGNVAANLVALGAEVEIASVVGEGPHCDTLLGLLDSIQVGRESLFTDPLRMVTLKTRIVVSNQQMMRYDIETRAELDIQAQRRIFDGVAGALADCDALVLSDYGKGVLTKELSGRLMKLATEFGKPVLCDPKGRDFTKYMGATVLTPNRSEAAAISERALDTMRDVEAVGHQIRERYAVKNLLITLGGDGMALFGENSSYEHIETAAQEVFDVTGAGDTVLAALAFALACGVDVEAASRFANAAAGVAVGRFGAVTVSRNDVYRVVAGQAVASGDKVIGRDELTALGRSLRSGGRKVVFTNGCFDVLHAGHIAVLERARQLGDVLVVGLNDDLSVARLKPGRPINSVADRSHLLAALSCVDFVTVFTEDTPLELIESLAPDVLVKGGDHDPDSIVGAPFVRDRGGMVVTVPRVPNRSTSEIVARIKALGETGEVS
jgi:D-beta-D-heptose 7-phosphate kinase/D-beta-D-heptose 1-phosphate adenosyltransferase